ncbi:MAG: hypothetical protein WD200_04005 [Candidatus Andersenbacteria bacterium]
MLFWIGVFAVIGAGGWLLLAFVPNAIHYHVISRKRDTTEKALQEKGLTDEDYAILLRKFQQDDEEFNGTQRQNMLHLIVLMTIGAIALLCILLHTVIGNSS